MMDPASTSFNTSFVQYLLPDLPDTVFTHAYPSPSELRHNSDSLSVWFYIVQRTDEVAHRFTERLPRRMIYLIDDDLSVRRAVTRLLKAAEYSVRAFASSEEFLENVRPTENDCLIVDVHMPGMSGLELQQALLDNDLHVPVIIITGRDDEASKIAARRLGAVGFFSKPFSDQALIDTIEYARQGSYRRCGGASHGPEEP